MLQPLGMAIVFTMITPLERPRFMALLGIPALLAPLSARRWAATSSSTRAGASSS